MSTINSDLDEDVIEVESITKDHIDATIPPPPSDEDVTDIPPPASGQAQSIMDDAMSGATRLLSAAFRLSSTVWSYGIGAALALGLAGGAVFIGLKGYLFLAALSPVLGWAALAIPVGFAMMGVLSFVTHDSLQKRGVTLP